MSIFEFVWRGGVLSFFGLVALVNLIGGNLLVGAIFSFLFLIWLAGFKDSYDHQKVKKK